MKYDVLVFGELLVDLISEQYVTRLKEATTFSMHPGGSPANVCANLNWLGFKTAMVSCVGDDSIGDLLLESFSKMDLDINHITRSKTLPTSIVLVGKSKATPDFIAYRMADTQIAPVDDSLIQNSTILHTSAFALSREPARSSILQAFDSANKMGKLISVDWNYAPGIWQEEGIDVFMRLCSYKPLMKLSLDDVERFLKRPVNAEQAMEFLSVYDATLMCLTCGKDGVWYKQQDGSWCFKPAMPVREVKDVTGAGDAFWSGFLQAYLRKHIIEECIDSALTLAAKKIQRVGPLYA